MGLAGKADVQAFTRPAELETPEGLVTILINKHLVILRHPKNTLPRSLFKGKERESVF